MQLAAALALYVVLLALQRRSTSTGSDHYIHVAYINSIRSNRHHFISKVDAFINEDDFPDPQLYHWLLSYLSPSAVRSQHLWIGSLIDVVGMFVFLAFCAVLWPSLGTGVFSARTAAVCVVLYATTPFFYVRWNAKSVGLSARGLGLLLGQLCLYLTVLFLVTGSPGYFAGLIGTAILVILTSQFALQMLVFVTALAAVTLGRLELLAVVPCAALLYFAALPLHATHFFKRQCAYKKLYAKVMAPKLLLTARPSVWRDLVYDFWMKPQDRPLLRHVEYVYRNPVTAAVVGFPLLMLTGVSTLTGWPWQMAWTNAAAAIGYLVLIGWGAFLCTSFRPTRFLGEPERYLEFFVPIAVPAIVVAATGRLTVLAVTVSVSLLIIAVEIAAIDMVARQSRGPNGQAERSLAAMDLIQAHADFKPGQRVLSNNYDVLKFFAGGPFRILNVMTTSEFTGRLHYNDIYPGRHGDFSPLVLPVLIREFGIEWFVLETTTLAPTLFDAGAARMENIGQAGRLKVYRTC